MISRPYIEKRLARLSLIEEELSKPEILGDQKLYRKLVSEHNSLKKLSARAEAYFHLLDTIQESRGMLDDADLDEELKELAQVDLDEAEENLPIAEKVLMVALLPPDPNDSRNAMMEIRAGTGGDEAALFAGDLYRMYSRYAESQGWKLDVIDASSSEIGGYKEVVFKVEGDHAYGILQYESGGHRVQRVPLTESQGRIHTSAATVAVFPEAESDDDIEIPAEDVRVDIFRSSGPGGQSVNTTDSAVRLTHVPTGLVVQCQDQKSQHRNKEKAMVVLKSRILDKKRREEQEKMSQARRQLIGSGDRSQRIRTYNFPQNRLTDHRINLTLYSLEQILEGNLIELLEKLREHDTALRLEEELTPKEG